MKQKSIVLLVLLSALMVLFGCSGSKHTLSATEVKTEIKADSTDSMAQAALQKIKQQYEAEQKKQATQISFYAKNNNSLKALVDELTANLKKQGTITADQQALIDKIKAEPCNEGGTLKVNADGSLEASNVKAYKAEANDWKQKYDSTAEQSDYYYGLWKSATEKKTDETIMKKKDVKRGLPWWVWLLIPVFLFVWERIRKYVLPVINKIIPFKL